MGSALAAIVTSFTLVWIKIYNLGYVSELYFVTSFTLVWIKIVGSLGEPCPPCHELHARVD